MTQQQKDELLIRMDGKLESLGESMDKLSGRMDDHVKNHNADTDKLFAFKNKVLGGLGLLALFIPTLMYILTRL